MTGAELALVLAVDGSASVTLDEFNLICGGTGAALRDPDVAAGLTAGHGSLVSVVLWSGPGEQEVMRPWTRLTTADDVASLAQSVSDMPRSVRAGETAIGEALLVAQALLAALPAPAARRVIDVAGDGRNNAGPAPAPIRDRLAGAGVTINGLCVLHDEPDLLESYTTHVIGGPGAFAVVCADYDGFAEAMRRKLVREVA